MKRLIALCGMLAAAACQTPGYDYTARAAPAYAEALNYTDVAVGRFRGPAGDVAEMEFQALIGAAELEGIGWFTTLDPNRPQGIYDGDVTITGFRRETIFRRERRCDKHRGLFNCERHVVIEMHCPKDIVDVSGRCLPRNMAAQPGGRTVLMWRSIRTRISRPARSATSCMRA